MLSDAAERQLPTMTTSHSSRRQFLVGSISGLGSTWFALRWPAILQVQEQARRSAEPDQPLDFEFFSHEQAVEIEAMAAQIIPSDNIGPGAREAQAIHFIDGALVTFDRDKQGAYAQGLADLAINTRKLFPAVSKFSSLTAAQQIQVLTAIEKTQFFELVRLHTIMGYLCRPEYGGNYQQAGWSLIGFEDEMIYKPPFGYYDGQR